MLVLKARLSAFHDAIAVQCPGDMQPGETLCFDGHTFLVREVIRLQNGVVYQCRREDMRTVYVENVEPTAKKKPRRKGTKR